MAKKMHEIKVSIIVCSLCIYFYISVDVLLKRLEFIFFKNFLNDYCDVLFDK